MGAPEHGLHVLDWIVVLVYLIGMLAIGWVAGRRVKDARGFHTAGGRLGSLLVGLSLLGTYLSAMTMIALPGVAFGPDGMRWSIQLPFLIVTALVITTLVLPRYRRAGVVSVYQFLELRIHVSARALASACFVALSAGRTGLTLYLPALAYSQITGADILPAIVVMGLVTLAYTVWGGIEAVIWTDAIQVFVFTLGAVLSVVYILWDIHLVNADFWGIAHQFHKLQIWDPSLDFKQIASLWLVLQTLFETIRIYGTQQDMTQRYVTTRSTREANKSVWICIVGYIPLGFAFYFIGAALCVYYRALCLSCHPDTYFIGQLVSGKPRWDAMYPHFIAARLPVGVTGIVLAAVFAAAMSTMASLLNSGATVCVEDFYKRFWPKERSDRHYLGVSRALTVVIGVAAVGVALYCNRVGETGQLMWTKIMGYTTAGVLALMALAFLPIRIRPAAAVAGWVTAIGLVWYLSTFKVVHALLWPVIGNTAGFVVALVLNTLLVALSGESPFGPRQRFPLEATRAMAATDAQASGHEGSL